MADAEKEFVEHIKQAESHVIEAVKMMMSGKVKRPDAYRQKLERVQIAVTSLHMQELVTLEKARKVAKKAKRVLITT